MAVGQTGAEKKLPASIRTELQRLAQARQRNSQAIARAERGKTLTDNRDWARQRRARTRHLIELGGLVQKAGLVELVDDDRATLLGAFLDLADQLRGLSRHDEDPTHLSALWRRRGLRIFDADTESMPIVRQGNRPPEREKPGP